MSIMSKYAKKYDEWFGTPFGAYADRLEKSLIFRYLGDVRGKRILDLGCGTGNYAIELARRGAIVTGIDASTDMLGTAKEKARAAGLQIDFLAGKAEDMPLKTGSFDALVSVTACEFFGNMRMAASEMKRFFNVIRWKTTVFALPWMPGRMIAIFQKTDHILSIPLKFCGAFLAIEARN